MAYVEVHFHTIALEPARWTPRRVSQSLIDLLPRIAGAGFGQLEIYEPHLQNEAEWPALHALLREHGLKPTILSSYLNLMTVPEAEWPQAIDAVAKRLRAFHFSKVRIFPGMGVSPSDESAVKTFVRRAADLAGRLEGFEILLETHDHSIADDPDRMVQVVREIGAPHVGLLFQPLRFDGGSERDQFARQKEFIRHVHLQNRNAAGEFATLGSGLTPWPAILRELPDGVNVSLEFVPSGICPEDRFDVEAVLAQAQAEKAFVEQLG